MRAREFFFEAAAAKISKREQAATRGLNIFSKKIDSYDRLYDLNRLRSEEHTSELQSQR